MEFQQYRHARRHQRHFYADQCQPFRVWQRLFHAGHQQLWRRSEQQRRPDRFAYLGDDAAYQRPSATGAVLNGSVTVGLDETMAWFEWGTDTNYGNIAGTTVVPGKSGSNTISATLGGLPGNVYHYRLDATNDFGIVYGQDQSFTVGFAPAATMLSAINSASGATLNALVNPEGWDTTVYFQRGTNTTPGIDIGA